MIWRRKEPGHRQPWYLLCWTRIIRSPHVKALGHQQTQYWVQSQTCSFLMYSENKRVSNGQHCCHWSCWWHGKLSKWQLTVPPLMATLSVNALLFSVYVQVSCFLITIWGITLAMGSANERRCYIVTPSLIGHAHTQNDPCFTWPYSIIQNG